MLLQELDIQTFNILKKGFLQQTENDPDTKQSILLPTILTELLYWHTVIEKGAL